MSDGRYVISEVVKKTNIKSHTIRYWEDELELIIQRNNMGHRYYTDEDIELFLTIRDLKDKGFQLKAIKMLIPNLKDIKKLDSETMLKLKDDLNEKITGTLENDTQKVVEENQVPIHKVEYEEPVHAVIADHNADKMLEFKKIMGEVIGQAIQENNQQVTEQISKNVSAQVIKEMDYLLKLREEREEERFKRLDETIRDAQKSRQEVAATTAKGRKRKRLFRK